MNTRIRGSQIVKTDLIKGAGSPGLLWDDDENTASMAAIAALVRQSAGDKVHVYRSLTGTAAVTSSPYCHAKWDVTDASVTQYADGMVVCVKVPVAGNGSYGTGLQINSLGYKPVVYNVNTMISTRYGVGSVVWAVYNSTQTATLHQNSGSGTTVTGCWQVMDYDTSNLYNTTAYYQRLPLSAGVSRYALICCNRTRLVPLYAGASSAGTSKVMTTESFDPFLPIYYYPTNTSKTAGDTIGDNILYTQYHAVALRYSLNCGTTLTAGKPVYLVTVLQADGLVKLATAVNPWAQDLPASDDGYLYILLGYSYSTSQINLIERHTIYYHDGTGIRVYAGHIPFSGSYNDLSDKPAIPAVPTMRTVNGEALTDSTRGDANLLDGFYFPNAVRDYDGNWYGAVVIGDQVWMAENLRTTHYADGTAIPEGGENSSTSYPYYYDYSTSDIPLAERGYLYNWPAVMNGESSSDANPSGVQGIAPDGWHVPSKAEFEQLADYVGQQERYRLGNDSANIAKALASTEHWNTSTGDHTPGNDPGRNNATGFGVVPAGIWRGGLYGAGDGAFFWSSTEYGSNDAWNRTLNYTNAGVNRNYNYRSNGFSVRCVSDLSPVQFRDRYVRTYGSLQHHTISDRQGDFDHTQDTTVRGGTATVTFAAAKRGSAMLTISADIALTIACNNRCDNRIWLKNTGVAAADVTVQAVTLEGSAVGSVYMPEAGISVPAGNVCEIGIVCNEDGAFVTSRNDLKL